MSDQLWRLPLFPLIRGVFSLGVKWKGHKVDHSPPCTTTVNEWSYTFSPYICLRAMQGNNLIAVIIPTIATNSWSKQIFHGTHTQQILQQSYNIFHSDDLQTSVTTSRIQNVELITHSGCMLHYILTLWFLSVVGTKVPPTIRLCLAPMPKCSTHKKANITKVFVGTFQNKWQKHGYWIGVLLNIMCCRPNRIWNIQQ
jgi:hypothetical protein